MKTCPALSNLYPWATACLRGAAAAVLLSGLTLAGACATTEGPDSPSGTAERSAAAPLNSSPQATLPAPEEAAPAKPFVEPRSEWSIDDSIETPPELRGLELFAKFKKEDGRVVIIYEAKNGDVYRRIFGAMGAYTRVEEARIELDP